MLQLIQAKLFIIQAADYSFLIHLKIKHQKLILFITIVILIQEGSFQMLLISLSMPQLQEVVNS